MIAPIVSAFLRPARVSRLPWPRPGPGGVDPWRGPGLGYGGVDDRTDRNGAGARHAQSSERHVTDDVDLARKAAAGDAGARAAVSAIAHPIVSHQTNAFCKRFCGDNRHQYACTLFTTWGLKEGGAPMCEWGNGSYAWMLDDLTGSPRLGRFEGRDGATLSSYLFTIANSRPFYERWKDWRFGRRTRVPAYVQALDPAAGLLFLMLRDGHELPAIAQAVGISEARAEVLAARIIEALMERKRLYLLVKNREQSLTGVGAGSDDDEAAGAQGDLPSFDPDPEADERLRMLGAGWAQLEPLEQYVLEAMLVDGLAANEVLAALQRMGISVREGVAPEDMDPQQVFHFRRKALKKLARLSGLLE